MEIVIISSDIVSSKMAGPGIRYLEIAKSLSKDFKVTLLTPNHSDLQIDSFAIEPFSKEFFLNKEFNTDAILLQGRILWENPFLKKLRIPLIIDLYDPFIFEEIEVNCDKFDLKMQNKLHKSSMSVLIDQLKYGDYFICATEKQRDLWVGMLTILNRINPIEYQVDKTLNNLIGVVPFGLNNTSPKKSRNVLKGVIPNILDNDKVLLWGGGIWDWLDPKTAIDAIEILSKRRKDIKLFFMGVKHPNPQIGISDKVKDLIQYTEAKGMRDISVFFNEWVEYNERQNYLLESDIGLNVHLNHIETRFAFRTRILDYIWCDLPVITTEGDIISEYVIQHNIGKVVHGHDPLELANNIEYLLEFPPPKQNFNLLKYSLDWTNNVECIRDYLLNKPKLSKGKNEQYRIIGVYRNMYQAYLDNGISLMLKGELSVFLKKAKSFLSRKI
ncbi:glycosyltransferase [Lysinibacillus capsici]|uniref:glycosyltransferase n=1 Tax=Lysinibacillus capsici TaxID=2115968 RepID=UPI00272EF624|nr:glycosyltransferase [Lysinibacillus capsici]MDP1394622.1 glycosyltransferase [Lysinibacillus capsici]MDP1415315.1 glycosyltransferase [Lysinibacillus capsici]MDP1430985.1 glycosyltransferase [Lysinibacillus capsici]